MTAPELLELKTPLSAITIEITEAEHRLVTSASSIKQTAKVRERLGQGSTSRSSKDYGKDTRAGADEIAAPAGSEELRIGSSSRLCAGDQFFSRAYYLIGDFGPSDHSRDLLGAAGPVKRAYPA